VNGVNVVRANIEADYGIIHIIDGFMDREDLISICPFLGATSEGQLIPAASSPSFHSINLRKVSDHDSLPTGPEVFPYIKANGFNNLFDDNLDGESPHEAMSSPQSVQDHPSLDDTK